MAQRKRHWLKIGVELEGGWASDPNELLEYSELVDVKGDGSVRDVGRYPGEVTVGPYDRMDRCHAAMAHCYPAQQNASCGLHVHLSFSREDMRRLATKGFLQHLKAFWEDWGKRAKIHKTSPYWTRLAGLHRYCLFSDDPARCFDHYSMVNFGAWQEHGTVECRLLPMFKNPLLAQKAVQAVVDCFEEWLNKPASETRPSEAHNVVINLSAPPGKSDDRTQARAKEKLERFKARKATGHATTDRNGYWCDTCQEYHD